MPGRKLDELVLLRRVRDRIDREYAKPLSVEALGREVGMSAARLAGALRHNLAMGAPNLFDPAWDFEGSREEGGATTRAVRLGGHAGAERLGATLYELEPGAMASPLHFHHGAEEMLFVIAGEPTLRTGTGEDDERVLATGEVVSFPPGREGTHQVLNRSAAPVRVLVCSTNDLPEVAEQVETGLTVVLTAEYDRLYKDGVDIG